MEQFTGKVAGIENYFIKGKVDAQIIRVGIENSFTFLPGQYLMVSEDGFRLKADPSKVKWTTYSIASSPLNKGILEFVYTIKYTGGFTQYLAENLKVGGKLSFKGPLGNFVLEENGKEKVFVATGAGIAPIISMIRTLLKKDPGKIRFFYGFRTGSHFLYKKELESFQKFPNFQLLTTVSREDPVWKGERGYVQNLLEKNSFDPQKEEAYLCGNPEMVQQVRTFFLGKGFAKEQVKIEQW